MTNPQLRRRFWLIIHEIFVHPFVGIVKVLSPSTKPAWANDLHDATIPPLPLCDEGLGDD